MSGSSQLAEGSDGLAAEVLANSQTSCPADMMYHLKLVALKHYRSLRSQYQDMFQKFLMVKPWEMNPPLPWRTPRYNQAQQSVGTGWVIVNLPLSPTLKKQIDDVIESINTNGGVVVGGKSVDLSYRMFAYTVIWWWCKWVFVMEK